VLLLLLLLGGWWWLVVAGGGWWLVQDVVGFNKAAMAYLRSNIELSSSASFFADAPLKLAQIRQQGTKRKHAATKKKNKKRTSAADAAAANIIE
jgi:hypothetical protein